MVPDLITGNDRLKIIDARGWYRIDHRPIHCRLLWSCNVAFSVGSSGLQGMNRIMTNKMYPDLICQKRTPHQKGIRQNDTGVRSKAWRIDICIFHTSSSVLCTCISSKYNWNRLIISKRHRPRRRRNLERQSGSGKKGQSGARDHHIASPGMSCTGSQVVPEPYIIIADAHGWYRTKSIQAAPLKQGHWSRETLPQCLRPSPLD